MRIRSYRVVSALFGFVIAGILLVSAQAQAGVELSQAAASRAEAVSGSAPFLAVVTDMSLATGETADQALHATDADGDSLTFSKAAGPAYMTVTTTVPGTGSATGNIHLTPGAADAGNVNAIVQVTDGALYASRSFSIHVSDSAELPPVLVQPGNMSVRAGEVREQTVYASDPNGDPLTFLKAFGPTYMVVSTVDPAGTGVVRLQPPSGIVGTVTGAVQVTDGTLSDQKSFTITVTGNSAPTLSYPSSMTVPAGGTADQTLYAYDSDGDSLYFSMTSGPSFVSVTTLSPGAGSATGLLHLAPLSGDAGYYNATIRVDDGLASDQKGVFITVTQPNRPPVVGQPTDMTMVVGEIAEQTVSMSDPDGDYLSVSKASGPAFVTVYGYGYGSFTVTARPGFGDVGTSTVVVNVSDYYHVVTTSFAVTVQAGAFPALCPSNSFLGESIHVGSGLIEVQTADLNGDGTLDLVAELADEDRIAVLLNSGDGSFQDPPQFLAAADVPASGAIADFNGDGIPDLAVSNYGYSANFISVFLGDGSGGFGARRDFPCGGRTRSVVAGDLNRDGKVDLVATRSDQGTLAVLRGLGNGTFGTATSVTVGAYPWALQLVDLNRDGALDVVVTNPQDNDFSVLLNNGTGTLGSRTDYPSYAPLGIATGDLNGDGKPDVAVTGGDGNFVSVFFGLGNGSLGNKRSFPTSDRPSLVVAADLNGDGHADLATANYYGGNVSLLLGDGAGAFAPRTDLPADYGAYGLATGDFDDDLRTDLAAACTSGNLVIQLNQCAPDLDHPPVVHAPRTTSASEGVQLALTVTASDPDGPALTGLTANLSGLPLGHDATFVADPEYGSGTLRWTPTYQDARGAAYAVTFTASNVLSGSATTKIFVQNSNRAPTANAGGPYTAFVGAALSLNGAGSFDPDGDAIQYAWTYGDGSTGSGVNPMHTYTAVGVYGVALTVTDGSLYSVATTTASIVEMLQARVFTENGNRSIRLSAGKPKWCAAIEPVGHSFDNVEVDLTTLVMKSTGTGSVDQIHAITGKTSISSDSDGNGVAEIDACFTKDDLRLLFSKLRGTSTVTVTMEGRLFAGGVFRASMDVQVLASGGGQLAASVSPNPLNPDATLTFRTERAGAARVDLFDIHGRLVRQLLAHDALEAGYHDLKIDGRNDRGEKLASGIYFYRVRAGGEESSGQFAILK